MGQFGAAGLSYAFDGPPAMTEVGAAVGAAGLPGVVYHDPEQGIPGRIDWYLMAPHWWIGMATGQKPTANDLKLSKNSVSLGYSVPLADGGEWTVPVVLACADRDPKRATGLPRVYRTAGGGELPENTKIPGFLLPGNRITLEVASEYADLRRSARKFLDALETALDGEQAPQPTEHETLNFCVGCLAVSYRVRIHECMALGLFTPETVNSIVFAALDTEERMAAKLQAMANTVGETAEASA